MQSLQAELAQFGIKTITVNPGFFRTELLTEESTNYANNPISDYDEARVKQMEFWKGYNGQQSGDPPWTGSPPFRSAGPNSSIRRPVRGASCPLPTRGWPLVDLDVFRLRRPRIDTRASPGRFSRPPRGAP